MYRILYSISFFITLLLTVQVSAIDLDCNPSANCQRRLPFGVKVDDPACQVARAACRLKCGPLNDDANRYINNFRSQQNILLADIQKADEMILKNQSELGDQAKSLDNHLKLCVNLQEYNLKFLTDSSLKRQIAEAIEMITHTQSQDLSQLMEHLDQLQVSEEIKNQSKNILLFSNRSVADIRLLIKEYLDSQSSSLDSLILGAIVNCEQSMVNIKTMKRYLEEQTQFLMVDRNKKLQDYDNLSKEIRLQENRKCPSNLF